MYFLTTTGEIEFNMHVSAHLVLLLFEIVMFAVLIFLDMFKNYPENTKLSFEKAAMLSDDMITLESDVTIRYLHLWDK